MMARADFLKTLSLAAFTKDSPRRRTPNVLFIAVDDLRPELGIYGAAHVKSPRIDSPGRGGTVFTHAYCQSALCNPSRASAMTGLCPDNVAGLESAERFPQNQTRCCHGHPGIHGQRLPRRQYRQDLSQHAAGSQVLE
jgi:arylsulfatase A-like enzyme